MSKLNEGSIVDKLSHVLFYSHITPHSTTGLSPAELLQNRRIKSRLDLLRPDMESRVIEKQSKQQYYANMHSKIRQFQVGEDVYIRNFSSGLKWIPGQICSTVGNVSYNVLLTDGCSFIRHIDHIRKRFEGDVTCPLDPTPMATTNAEIPLESPNLSEPVTIPPVVEPNVVVNPPTPIVHPLPSDHSNSSPQESRYPKRIRGRPNRYTPSDLGGRNVMN